MSFLLDGNNQPDTTATSDLNKALEAFKTPSQSVTPRNPLTSSVAQTISDDEAEVSEEEVAEVVEEALAESEEPTEEETSEDSPFAAQFEQQFGMKPDEAVSLVNSLVGLRDEMTLMKEWGVTPGDYTSRMTAVKEFYGSLPEGDREQFNSPEGAKVIWNHLQSTSPQYKNVGKSTRGGNVRPTRNAQPPKEVIKRSEILAMDDKTYKANLQRITAAYREGRVLDNQ